MTNLLCCFLSSSPPTLPLLSVTLCLSIYIGWVLKHPSAFRNRGETVLASISIPNHIYVCVRVYTWVLMPALSRHLVWWPLCLHSVIVAFLSALTHRHRLAHTHPIVAAKQTGNSQPGVWARDWLYWASWWFASSDSVCFFVCLWFCVCVFDGPTYIFDFERLRVFVITSGTGDQSQYFSSTLSLFLKAL